MLNQRRAWVIRRKHSRLRRIDLGWRGARPEMHLSLDYFMPALVLDRHNHLLFARDAGFASPGIHLFDAVTRERQTSSPAASSGPPSDLVPTRSAAQSFDP